MDQLARRLGVPDAVVIGLGSMLGAGVFVVFAPGRRARPAAPGCWSPLALAGFVAFCNATSSARLAARYPESGGTYVYGRERLGAVRRVPRRLGFRGRQDGELRGDGADHRGVPLAGQARLVAVAAVVAVTAVNLRGIGKTATATRVLVAVVLAVLALVAVGWRGGPADRTGSVEPGGSARGVLTAAGLLFFAFAGYARIATLGEEVRDPERTIPRAVPLALGVVLAIYLVLAVVTLGVLGADRLAGSAAPLADVVTAAGLPGLAWVVRAGATVAVTGVLLSLLAGVGRTTLAMARRRDLPGALAAVHPVHRVPHRAELAVAAVVIVVVRSATYAARSASPAARCWSTTRSPTPRR